MSSEQILHNQLCDIFAVTLEAPGSAASSPAGSRARLSTSFFLRSLSDNLEVEQRSKAEASADARPGPLFLRAQDVDAILVERLESFTIPQSSFTYLSLSFGRAYVEHQKQKLADDVFDICTRSITTHIQLVLLDNVALNLPLSLLGSFPTAASLASLAGSYQPLSDPKAVVLLLDKLTAVMELKEIESVFSPLISSVVDQVVGQSVAGGVLGPLHSLAMLVSVPKIASIVR